MNTTNLVNLINELGGNEVTHPDSRVTLEKIHNIVMITVIKPGDFKLKVVAWIDPHTCIRIKPTTFEAVDLEVEKFLRHIEEHQIQDTLAAEMLECSLHKLNQWRRRLGLLKSKGD